MEQITIVLNSMEDVTREINNCQRNACTSIVQIGYILRKADDAELYKEKGYSSIFKFAEQEYGWKQSQTSRFMDINKEFSEGGYSTQLKAQYEGYEQTKLAEMLTLPETIREELNPDMKREDIRNLKKDLREAEGENQEADFAAAVMMEPTDGGYLNSSVRQLLELPEIGKKLPELYPLMVRLASGGPVDEEDIRMALSSTGFGFKRAGGVMYFFKDEYVNLVKGADKQKYTYRELLEAVNGIDSPLGISAGEWYQRVYGKEIPGTEKPPVPEKEEVKKPEPKVPKQKPEQKKEKKQDSSTSNDNLNDSEEREELEGQTEAGEFAEKLPITYEKDEEKAEKEDLPVAPAHKEDKQEDGCPYCSGKKDICSLDAAFRIRLHGKPIGKITRGIYNATIEFNYCPMCGKELK